MTQTTANTPNAASDIAQTIRHQSAFTLKGYQKRGGNRDCRWYSFKDGSRLIIGRGWQKVRDDQGRIILHGPIQVNSFGHRQG